MAAFQSILLGFVCWLFGSLLFFATQKPMVWTSPLHRRIVSLTAAILQFIGVLCLSRMPHLLIGEGVKDVAVSGSFAFLLLVLIGSAQTYPSWLAPLGRFGAGSSYSLYVIHFPLVVLLAALFLTPAQRLPPSGGLLLSFVGIGFVATIYGYAVSKVTEANTSKLRRWLKLKYSNFLPRPNVAVLPAQDNHPS